MKQESPTETNIKYSVRSLEKALDLLEFLESRGTPMGVRNIATDTGIPKSTAQRLLEVMERRGYVKKHNGKYSLWIGTVPLSRSFLKGDMLMRLSHEILVALTEVSFETSSLYVRQGYDRILVQRVESPHPLRFFTLIGERLPLHLGASGQVLCSGIEDEELLAYFTSVEPVILADGTKLDKYQLLDRIKQVRINGYAIGIAERYKDVTSIAAPVISPTGEVLAAINIVGPASRMEKEKLELLSIEIRGAVAELSSKIAANM